MCMDRHTGRQTDIQAARQTHRQAGRQTDILTARQAGTMKLTVAFHSSANVPKKAKTATGEFFGSPVSLTFCPECMKIKLHGFCCR